MWNDNFRPREVTKLCLKSARKIDSNKPIKICFWNFYQTHTSLKRNGNFHSIEVTKLCLKSARKTESNKPIKIKNLKRLSNVYFLYYCGEMHNIFYFFWTEVSKWHFTLINLQKWTNYLLSTIIFVMKWINKWLFIRKISPKFQNFFLLKAYKKCKYLFYRKFHQIASSL